MVALSWTREITDRVGTKAAFYEEVKITARVINNGKNKTHNQHNQHDESCSLPKLHKPVIWRVQDGAVLKEKYKDERSASTSRGTMRETTRSTRGGLATGSRSCPSQSIPGMFNLETTTRGVEAIFQASNQPTRFSNQISHNFSKFAEQSERKI